MDDTEKERAAPVYVAWATLNNALTTLSQGIPNQIDRTVFPGLAWSVQSQLMSGLKFLGLIDDDGKPLRALQAVAVADEDKRRAAMATLLRERYADLFALDLTKTTPAELDKVMGATYKVQGSTRERCVRFFLAAAGYAGVPLSPLVKPKGAGNNNASSAGRPRRRLRDRRQTATTDAGGSIQDTAQVRVHQGGTSKTVSLRGGGTLTLAATLDVFSLTETDRVFVFGLIDKLNDYERAGQSQE